MSEKDSNTEQIILKAARKVFTHKGFDGARMQEIADEAGINKALLHYYFRSKDKLFEAIFKEVITTFFPRIISVLTSDLSLFEKITLFTERYIDILTQNPDIAGFVIHEVSVNPHRLVGNIKEMGADINLIDIQLQQEIAAGNIIPIKAGHFVANLISMCVFPVIARPVLMGMMNYTDEQYRVFLEERKKIVPQTIIQSLRIVQ